MTQAISIDNDHEREDIMKSPESAEAANSRSRDISQFIYIRVAACIAIILLHSLFASTVYFEDSITPTQLRASQTVQHMLMWAVPCFLMVTGALLLRTQRQITNRKLFGKYIRRMALALVFFTFMFQLIDYIKGEESSLIGGWISNLLQGHSWPHMWYLYLMIGIYLMIPFYKMIADRAGIEQIWQLTATIIFFVSIVPMLLLAGFEDYGFYIPTSLIYPAYVFGGYALYQKNVSVRSAACVFILSSALIIGLSIRGVDTEIYGYDSILVVAQSLSLFSLMLRMKAPAGVIISSIDECGFGIYLIHMIGVVFVMKWIGFDPYAHIPVISFAVMVLVFFSVSYAATWLIRQIPKLDLL